MSFFEQTRTIVVGMQLTPNEIAQVAGGHNFASHYGMGSSLNSNSELSMIGLQSIMSRRQSAVQMVSGVMQSMDSSTKDIIGNIKG